MVGLTDSQVNKAGRRLRQFFRGEDVGDQQVVDALDVIVRWRAAHSGPLTTANMGLRSAVSAEGNVRVTQRLKRIPTIFDKITREPTLKLSKMQDIGGCRAVVPDIAALQRVQRKVSRPTKAREHISTSDYVAAPRASGYRGVHVVVRYQGCAIELQLRTPVMHTWAVAVENLSSRYGEDYKSAMHPDVGPWLALVSEAMRIEEEHGEVPVEMTEEIMRLRLTVEEHFSGRQ